MEKLKADPDIPTPEHHKGKDGFMRQMLMPDKSPIEDVSIIEKIGTGPGGKGRFTWLKDAVTGKRKPFPFPGFPNKEIVKMLWVFKKLVPVLLDHWIHPILKHYTLPPKEYSHAVREIHRVFNVMIERELDPSLIKKFTQIRDIFCMGMEYDNAYRFRIQDALVEINLDEIKLDEGDRYYCKNRKDYKFKHKEEEKKEDEVQ